MIGQYKERNLVRCQQPLLLDGALRNSSKNGCKGDYKIPRVQMKGEMFLQFLVTENLTISHIIDHNMVCCFLFAAVKCYCSKL